MTKNFQPYTDEKLSRILRPAEKATPKIDAGGSWEKDEKLRCQPKTDRVGEWSERKTCERRRVKDSKGETGEEGARKIGEQKKKELTSQHERRKAEKKKKVERGSSARGRTSGGRGLTKKRTRWMLSCWERRRRTKKLWRRCCHRGKRPKSRSR